MKPRIAIACSGLGHVHRGSETWATTTADGLHRAGADVTLIGGGEDVRVACRYVRLANWRRDNPLTRSWFSWHNRYLLEQRTFAIGLLQLLKREQFDFVHLTDPALAWIIQRNRRAARWRVIYMDGLLLGLPWCERFDCVQLLAPPALKEAQTKGVDTDHWFVIPHLVNTHHFAPLINRESIRAKLLGYNVRADAPVILGVGDLSPGSNKRLDWIVKEIAQPSTPKNAHLLIAGHAAPGVGEAFVAEAKKTIGDRIHLVTNLPANQMAEVYQAADVFVHAALREPFGIVFLEAMASGLPVIAHQFPVTEWIVGDGGKIVDMSAPGQLAAVLAEWIGDVQIRAAVGRRARLRAVSEFSSERIIPEYQAMYAQLHRPR